MFKVKVNDTEYDVLYIYCNTDELERFVIGNPNNGEIKVVWATDCIYVANKNKKKIKE